MVLSVVVMAVVYLRRFCPLVSGGCGSLASWAAGDVVRFGALIVCAWGGVVLEP